LEGRELKWWETGANCIMSSFITYNWNDEVKEDEMACSTHWGREECI
jgi:hypothetical protein